MSQIVNIRVKRNNSEFKNFVFHDSTVLNKTIPATKHEIFFTKVAGVQSLIDIGVCAIGVFINTAPSNVYFILHYHLFFRK